MKKFYLKYIKPFLSFIRLIDKNGELSITNLVIIIFTFKFAITPMETFSIESIVPVIGAMGMYYGKRYINHKENTQAENDTKVTDDIINKMKEFANMDD